MTFRLSVDAMKDEYFFHFWLLEEFDTTLLLHTRNTTNALLIPVRAAKYVTVSKVYVSSASKPNMQPDVNRYQLDSVSVQGRIYAFLKVGT